MSTAEEKHIINKIVSLKQESSNARTTLETDYRTYWEMYNGKLNTDSEYPWRSHIFMKEVFKAIDTIHPIFMNMLYQSGDPFRIKGNKGDLTETQARVLERLIKIYIDKMDCYNTFDDLVKDILLYGTAFAKVYWKREVINFQADVVSFENKQYDIVGLKFTRKVKVTKKVPKSKIIEGPCIDRVDYKDIFVGTRCDNIQKYSLIHRTWKSYEALCKENEQYKATTGEDLYKNLETLKRKVDLASRAGDLQDQITRAENQQLGLTDSTETVQQMDINGCGELEILEYWTADNMQVITVAGGQEVIRSSQNPFKHGKKPFLHMNYIRRPGRIYGIGCCELAADGQALLNTSVNQMVDNNTLTNNFMLIADREANIDFDQMKSRPGGIVFVDKEVNERLLDKVQQVKFAKVDASNVINMAISEIQEVTGAGRMSQGTYESGAVRNTSQQQGLLQQSNKRFSGKVVTYEEMCLKPFVRMLYGMIQQFITDDMVVNMIGSEDDLKYVRVTAADIARDIDFYPVGSKQLIELEQAVHQMNNFLAIVSGDPTSAMLINKRYLYQKIWDCISPDHDGHKVILSDKEAKRAFEEQKAIAEMGGANKIMEGGSRQAGLGGGTQNAPSRPNMAGGVQ